MNYVENSDDNDETVTGNSFLIDYVPGSGLEKMELDHLQIVDAIKGYKSKSVSHSR